MVDGVSHVDNDAVDLRETPRSSRKSPPRTCSTQPNSASLSQRGSVTQFVTPPVVTIAVNISKTIVSAAAALSRLESFGNTSQTAKAEIEKLSTRPDALELERDDYKKRLALEELYSASLCSYIFAQLLS